MSKRELKQGVSGVGGVGGEGRGGRLDTPQYSFLLVAPGLGEDQAV